MSKVQVDTIVDKDDVSAPTFSKGAIVTGVCTATTFVGALTGNADTATTATTTSGNAGGLTGTPSITVNNAVVTSTTVGSAVTANSDGVIITGIATVIGDISQKGSTLDVAADIRHVGDTDTKISFTDNNIALDTAGSTALNIDSSGNVSVGYAGNSLYFQNGFNDSNSRILNGGASNNSDLTFHTRSSGTDGERLRIGSAGDIGIAGANYGTSGQVFTSGGSGAAVSWATPSAGLSEYEQWQITNNTETTTVVWAYDVIGSSDPSGGPATVARVTSSQNPRFVKLGTGMSFSNGIWTFPSTGYWECIFTASLYTETNAVRNFRMRSTENDSTYTVNGFWMDYGSLYFYL